MLLLLTVLIGSGGSLAEAVLAQPHSCSVTSLEVIPFNTNGTNAMRRGMSVDQVLSHLTYLTGVKNYRWTPSAHGKIVSLSRPSSLLWVLTQATSFSCIDGRKDDAVVGAFGGDIGEFILGLASIELTRPMSAIFSQSQVTAYFKTYLAELDHKFYMHTDAIHWLRWKEVLQRSVGLAVPFEVRTAEQRAKVLESAPQYIGCGHLKLMMLQEKSYRTRRELVEHVIRAVVSVLLDSSNPLRSKIIYDILDGYPGSEQAFVDVLSPGPEVGGSHSTSLNASSQGVAFCAYRAPSVVPRLKKDPKRSVAVFHPRAVYEARAHLAHFFARFEQKDKRWRWSLFRLMNEVARDQMRLTKQQTMSGLATYIARYS